MKKIDEHKKTDRKKEKKIDVIINCFINQNYLSFEKQKLKSFKTL